MGCFTVVLINSLSKKMIRYDSIHISLIRLIFSFWSDSIKPHDAHQSLDFLVIDHNPLILQFQRDSAISISLFMTIIDVDDSIHDGIVFFVFVDLIACVIIGGPFQSGNLKKDLQWIFWLQFLNNIYFFFGCRSFLA